MLDKLKNNKVFVLFITFFKIGAFTFGGGYAMIPLLQREVVEKQHWLTEEDILDIIVVAESTPGPIAINFATFVGFRVGGFIGALVSTLGAVIPSFVVISVISVVLSQFKSLKAVTYAFVGIRAGVLALILKALFTMSKKCPKNILSYVIAAAAFLSAVVFDVNALYIIIACAVIGIVLSLFKLRRKN